MQKKEARIETHPFMPEDFTKDDLFVVKILKEGIEITNYLPFLE